MADSRRLLEMAAGHIDRVPRTRCDAWGRAAQAEAGGRLDEERPCRGNRRSIPRHRTRVDVCSPGSWAIRDSALRAAVMGRAVAALPVFPGAANLNGYALLEVERIDDAIRTFETYGSNCVRQRPMRSTALQRAADRRPSLRGIVHVRPGHQGRLQQAHAPGERGRLPSAQPGIPRGSPRYWGSNYTRSTCCRGWAAIGSSRPMSNGWNNGLRSKATR